MRHHSVRAFGLVPGNLCFQRDMPKCIFIRTDVRFRYLLQQEYQASDIVILTPYVAQLQEIRLALERSKELSAVLNDRDEEDLLNLLNQEARKEDGDAEIGELEHTAPQRPKKKVRVATVDNFQGEEANIILLSMVRCNENNNIGFLHDPGRVTVLLSRARDGFIVLGSRKTLTASARGASLWNGIFALLDRGGQVLSGLPSKCTVHGKITLLKSQAEFNQRSPDGGCQQACQERLPKCGHRCPLLCHSFDRQHVNVICIVCKEVARLEARANEERNNIVKQARMAELRAEKEKFEHEILTDQLQQQVEDAKRRKIQAHQHVERAAAVATHLATLHEEGVTDVPAMDTLRKKLQQQLAQKKKFDEMMKEAEKQMRKGEQELIRALSHARLLQQRQQDQQSKLDARRAEAESKLTKARHFLESVKTNRESHVRDLACMALPKQKPKTVLQRPSGAKEPLWRRLGTQRTSESPDSGIAHDSSWASIATSTGAHVFTKDYLQSCTNGFSSSNLVASTPIGRIYRARDPVVPSILMAVVALGEDDSIEKKDPTRLLRNPLALKSAEYNFAVAHKLIGFYQRSDTAVEDDIEMPALCLVYALRTDQYSVSDILLNDDTAMQFGWKHRVRAMFRVAQHFLQHGALPPCCVFVSPPEYEVQILALGWFKRKALTRKVPPVPTLGAVLRLLFSGTEKSQRTSPAERKTAQTPSSNATPNMSWNKLNEDGRCGPWNPAVVACLKKLFAEMATDCCAMKKVSKTLRALVTTHCARCEAECVAQEQAFRQKLKEQELAHQTAHAEHVREQSRLLAVNEIEHEECTRVCCICDDEFSIQNGVECEGTAPASHHTDEGGGAAKFESHFTCSDCLEQYVSAVVELPTRVLVDRNGDVFCPARNNESIKTCACYVAPLPRKALAKFCSDATYDRYIQRQVDVAQLPRMQKLEQDFEERVQAEVDRLARLTDKQRQVRLLRRRLFSCRVFLRQCPSDKVAVFVIVGVCAQCR